MPAGPLGTPWLDRAYEIIEQYDDMNAGIVALRDVIGVDHIVYHTSRFGVSPSADPYVILTYTGGWIKRYVEMNYLSCDPVLREGFLRVLPFDWAEMEIVDPREYAMLADAAAAGIGPHGLSVPVRSARGHRGLFSVSFGGTAPQWDAFKQSAMADLTQVAHRIHARVINQEFGDDQRLLTARELDCLFWVSEGKEATDIATILNISRHTVRDYLKSARFKLNCVTSTQAVSKAVKMGLIATK